MHIKLPCIKPAQAKCEARELGSRKNLTLQRFSKRTVILFLLPLLLTACSVGPDYKQPEVPVSAKYKEAPKGWKIAQPQDRFERGAWWKIFHDPQLNALEDQLNKSNQNIKNAEANYRNALAVLAQARAGYYPTINLSFAASRDFQRSASGSLTDSAGNVVEGATTGFSNTYALFTNAIWEPDLWGSVRRQVESQQAAAQASAALLASTRLSLQALLAQTYFQLQTADLDQKILDDTVAGYKKSLQLTQNRYKAGTAARSDVVQAQSLLQTAQANAINNKIARSQFEHAIAVLIGLPPANLSIKPMPLRTKPPKIPGDIPSQLLERRPDVAQAERQMQQANAQIGVAIAAFYPNIVLTPSANAQNNRNTTTFSLANVGWSLAGQITQTIFDGGLRRATTAAARANYDASVANYRQVVLTAFQDVEDQLVALQTLDKQIAVQKQAVNSAFYALKLITNQYKSGVAAYSDVILSEITAYNAQKVLADLRGQQMVAAVNLVKALGGGWDAKSLCPLPPGTPSPTDQNSSTYCKKNES